MEQGPSAISSASAMALANQTIDPRKAGSISSDQLMSKTNKQIIDVVETCDRDPRERLEYDGTAADGYQPVVKDVASEADADERSAAIDQQPGTRLDVQG